MPRRSLVTVIALTAVFVSQFLWVKTNNFWGFDEWVHLSLTSRGIFSFPQANRPLMLLWSLPAAWLAPHSLTSFYIVHASYLLLCGCAVYFACLRLTPRLPVFAFLAGVFSLVWVPLDMFRLSTLAFTGYSGLTFGTFLAIALFQESWHRFSRGLLALAALVAYVTARGFEGVVPLLACAPFGLLVRRRSGRAHWLWLGVWLGVLAVVTAQILPPILFQTAAATYQTSVLGGLDLQPLNLLTRLHAEYTYHLLPLGLAPKGDFGPGLPIAALVFVLAYAAVTSAGRQRPVGPEGRSALLRWAAAGLCLAALGYAPFIVSASTGGPARTQFLSTPGIAVFLASLTCLLGTWRRAVVRHLVVAALAVWIVSVGTSRLLAMQRGWDRINVHAAQNAALVQLTALAPDLKPATLVVLIDERRVWPATFTWRHAIRYVYRGRATGHVWNGWEIGYPTWFEPSGIRCEPLPVIREPWQSPATLHAYEETVVVRFTAEERLLVLEDWPEQLPALPPGARYDPYARIVTGSAPPPQRGILVRN